MITRFITRRRERKIVLDWIEKELKDYADPKFNENPEWTSTGDDEHTREFGSGYTGTVLMQDLWWVRQVNQYLARAVALGLDNPQGRQALFKTSTTLLGFLESVVRVYGEPPEAGHPSGTIIIKDDIPKEE